jgi:hypothetical protein
LAKDKDKMSKAEETEQKSRGISIGAVLAGLAVFFFVVAAILCFNSVLNGRDELGIWVIPAIGAIIMALLCRSYLGSQRFVPGIGMIPDETTTGMVAADRSMFTLEGNSMLGELYGTEIIKELEGDGSSAEATPQLQAPAVPERLPDQEFDSSVVDAFGQKTSEQRGLAGATRPSGVGNAAQPRQQQQQQKPNLRDELDAANAAYEERQRNNPNPPMPAPTNAPRQMPQQRQMMPNGMPMQMPMNGNGMPMQMPMNGMQMGPNGMPMQMPMNGMQMGPNGMPMQMPMNGMQMGPNGMPMQMPMNGMQMGPNGMPMQRPMNPNQGIPVGQRQNMQGNNMQGQRQMLHGDQAQSQRQGQCGSQMQSQRQMQQGIPASQMNHENPQQSRPQDNGNA